MHCETTVVSIRSSQGVVVVRAVVPTTASALRRILGPARRRVKIACEAGPLAPWLKSVLQTQFREVIVCDRRRTRLGARGSSKSDRFDADRLSDHLRTGTLHPVYVPEGEGRELRRYLSHYVRMVKEGRRVKQRIKALFLESGVRLERLRSAPYRLPFRRLPRGSAREIARVYKRQLEAATELLAEARTLLLQAAARDRAFVLLQTIPYIGEIRSATLLGVVGNVNRFLARRKFWSYAGLGVVQRTSAEHRIENGQVVRNSRAHGIRRSRNGQPLLKKIMSDIAVHASAGRGELREIYEAHLARGKRPAVARLALARKIAAVIIGVWRTGKPYDPSFLDLSKKVSGRASTPQLSRARSSVAKATSLSICRPESSHEQPGAG